MIIGRWGAGAGNAKDAVRYLLGEIDSRGRERPTIPEVVEGDPILFMLATQGVSSGIYQYMKNVLSYGELVASHERAEVRVEFETMVALGLRRRTYWLWVKHLSDIEVHEHLLLLKQDLKTGKHLQPYHFRHDRERLYLWSRISNAARGLLDPSWRLAIRKVNVSGTRRCSIQMGTVNASLGREHLERELRAEGHTIVHSSSGQVYYVDREHRQTFRISGHSLRNDWIPDLAERMASYIKRLQLAVERKHRYLAKAYGPVEEIDILSLPSVQKASTLQAKAAPSISLAPEANEVVDEEDCDDGMIL